MVSPTALDETPGLPRDRDGPLFAEPWQAQAFALTVKLHEAGHFTWPEWVAYLSREVAAGAPAGASGAETVYYLQWLAALEKLASDKGLTSPAALAARKAEWLAAHGATAFGEPVTLEAAHRHDHEHDGRKQGEQT
ncbi:MAG: nitrile hydratase accessory protein [Alphaproteobacteria bacterium]